MRDERRSNWGLTTIVGAAIAIAIGYWIVTADQTPTLPFACGQGVLLLCALVATFDSFAKCRPACTARRRGH